MWTEKYSFVMSRSAVLICISAPGEIKGSSDLLEPFFVTFCAILLQ